MLAVAAGHIPRRVFDVAGLVVKEKVGLELAQEPDLGQAAEEHGFVHLDVPVHQGADRALVGWCAARGDQRGAHMHLQRALGLQAVRRFKQRLEGATGQRQGSLARLVRLKGRQALGLKHPLSPVREHRVAVECHAHLTGMHVVAQHSIRPTA